MEKMNAIIDEVKELLIKNYSSFHGIYLFGSRSRSEHTQESDIDLALIFNRDITWDFKDEVRNLIYNIMLKYDIVIDSHIYSKNDILKPVTPFRNTILSEGIFYGL